MTTQVAVRLSDAEVSYLDTLVAAGKAQSRADALRLSLQALRTAEKWRHDIGVLNTTPADADLETFTDWAAAQPTDLA